MRGRYECENCGLLNICMVQASWSSSVMEVLFQQSPQWEAEQIRWAWEGRGCPHRDALQWWDCLWFSPADVMNCVYCHSVFEHMEELEDKKKKVTCCGPNIYCTCKQKSSACAPRKRRAPLQLQKCLCACVYMCKLNKQFSFIWQAAESEDFFWECTRFEPAALELRHFSGALG